MPLTLAIETSNPSAAGPGGPGVALAADGWTDAEPLAPAARIAPGAPRAGQGGNDDDLMPAIDRLFARRGVRPSEITLVAVSVGPGGYTGLRIACAVGKMIAEAAGAPCVAVPTAAALARRVRPEAWSRGGVAVALAGKGESAWVRVVGPEGAVETTGGVQTVADVAGLFEGGVRTIVADGFLPAAMRAEAARLSIAVIEPEYDARAVLEAAAAGGGGGLARIDPVELVPLYPREPDAVTLWRERSVKR